MKQTKKEIRESNFLRYGILIFISIIIFSILVVAADPPPDAFYSPSKDGSVVTDTGNLAPDKSFAVSLFTGAVTYSYSINLPEGTKGLQPLLSISYNHQSTAKPGMVGAAWSLTENYIQRNINYTRNDTSDDKFKLILNGQPYDLICDSSDEKYHTEMESYLYIQNVSGGDNTNDGYWIVKTKDGTTYRFGFNNDSELVSNQENHTVRWYLDLVNDTYDNKIYYSYKENPNSGDVGVTYLYKIEYNNDKSRIIEFILEDSDRPDTWSYYEQGNLVSMSRRLREIQIKTNNSLVRKYVLDYSYLDTRSFLKEITLYGNDNSSELFSDSFSYYLPEKGWYEEATWESPYGFIGYYYDAAFDLGIRFADVNRDGYVDIIKGYKTLDGSLESVYVKINNGSGWVDEETNFPYSFMMTTYYWICNQGGFQYGVDRGMRLLNLNSDGFVDLLVNPHKNSDEIDKNIDNIAYLGGNNLSWSKNTSWAFPTGKGELVNWRSDWDFCKRYFGIDKGVRFPDLNGDGKADILSDPLSKRWINKNNGWDESTDWDFNESIVESYRRYDESCEAQYGIDEGVRFIDINSDGLDDVLIGNEVSGVKQTFINNGKEFVEIGSVHPEYFVDDQIWADPICNTRFGVDQGVRLADINGDGLIDILKSESTDRKVYINNGSGWIL